MAGIIFSGVINNLTIFNVYSRHTYTHTINNKIMKRIAIAFAFVTVFAACKNNIRTETTEVNAARDSIKMLQYSLKAVRDSIKLDSYQKAEQARLAQQQAAQQAERVSYVSARRPTYVKGVSEAYYYTPAKPVKRGWSSAAKGAVIGAGAGAVTGVLVDKKDGRGAIIGGLLGAGTGYVIGRAHDKKTGRAQ